MQLYECGKPAASEARGDYPQVPDGGQEVLTKWEFSVTHVEKKKCEEVPVLIFYYIEMEMTIQLFSRGRGFGRRRGSFCSITAG